MGKKKYIGLVLVTLLLALVKPVILCAQATISSPQLHCIAVDSVGDVTLTWGIPADTNNTFLSYDVFTSTAIGGPYNLSASVPVKTQNTVTINGLGANAAPFYFNVLTNTTGGYSVSNDTLKSIFLTVNNLVGVALLKWNAMHNPNLPSFNGWYKIYREYPQYVWKLIDSTKQLLYYDTIRICSATLNYKIVANDASGCQSVSNIAGGIFKNVIPPNSPPMDTVSVNAANGIDISWSISSTTDVIGYIIYKYNGVAWIPIDTVWGYNSTYFDYIGGTPGAGSESFRIAPIDSCNNVGPQDPAQRTIYLTQTPNQCAHENVLTWDSIENMPSGFGVYKVYASVNGGQYKIIGTTHSSRNTTFTDFGLSTPQTICYFVRAVDSITGVTATSNVICYTVALPPPPMFSYLNDATVVGNSKVLIDGYIDDKASIKNYIFERAPAPGGKYIVAGIVHPTVPSNTISFYDPTADPNLESYTYRIIVQDSCDYYIDTTNIGQTMFLTAVGTNTGLDTLHWNDYQWWKGNVIKYMIYRNEDDGPYSLIYQAPFINAGENTYVDDVSAFVQGQGVFCYYIQAVEGNNGYGFTDTSTSNIACAYQDPRIYIPNAFNPKGVNTIFVPIGVFVDLTSYDFTIFNRWGQLLFETGTPGVGWDGTFHGRLVEEGVYVYRLQYTSSKGEYFDKKGTVIMLK